MNSPYGLPAACHTCHLRREGFFCALSPESLEAFKQVKHSAVFPENAVLFVEGQAPHGVFMLCQGQAKLSTTSVDGKTLILRIAKAGEVLGLDAVVTGKPYDLTAETMEPCQLSFVDRNDFLRFLREHSDACLRAAQLVSRDLQDAHDAARLIGWSHSVSGRLAKLLLASVTDSRAKNGVVRTRLTMTHEDIAQLTGTTRETITRTLSEFRRNDIIELRGSTLIIHNRSALRRLVAS